MTAKLHIELIRDCEGAGRCGACQREGLRWVAQLSDGSHVGLECAKKVLGFRPAPKAYNWIADYTLTGTHTTPWETVGFWTSKDGRSAAITVNGAAHQFGPTDYVRGQLKRYL